MQTKFIERYFFFILLFITFLFSFLIFRPFWMVIVLGICFSVVLYPVYEWLINKKIPGWLSAILTIILFVIIVGIPLLGIGTIVFNQGINAYHSFSGNLDSFLFFNSISEKINEFLPTGFGFNLQEKMSDLISFILGNVASIFSSTLSTIFSVFLTLLSVFYFLKDGARFKKALVILSPLSDDDDQKIINKLAQSINAILKGYLFIALLQAILMGCGLALFGVPNPALWGLVTLITALVPTIGTALVSVPAIVFLFITGNTINAIGMTFWAIAIVGTIDNLLSPMIVGNKIKLPPLLILFSVLGGISLLGPVGILIGPLTISLLYTLISIYRNEYTQSIPN